jgi:hypothetical protein
MARVKTLYVRDEDAATWEKAAKAAAEEGMSLSEFVTTAIRTRLDQRPPSFELLRADSMEPLTPQMQVKRTYEFWGHWILRDAESGHPGLSQGERWSVAITKDGNFVVHVLRGGAPLMGADPNFEELVKKFLVPPDIAQAASEIINGLDWTVRRDSL